MQRKNILHLHIQITLITYFTVQFCPFLHSRVSAFDYSTSKKNDMKRKGKIDVNITFIICKSNFANIFQGGETFQSGEENAFLIKITFPECGES